MMTYRTTARTLARTALDQGKPLEWFEELYSMARDGKATIPWADLVPNPNVVKLIEQRKIVGNGRPALKIGCGLGDDAEYLAMRGFNVTAFDISSAAIAMAKKRFSDSEVNYVVADLLNPPTEWRGRFDFIWESYTLQVLPPDLRKRAIRVIPDLLAREGELVVVARARNSSDPEGEMPWPLLEDEMKEFERGGLVCSSFEDYMDGEEPPVRRFRAVYQHR